MLINYNLEASIGRSPSSINERVSLLKNLVDNGLIFSAQEIIRRDLIKGRWIKNYEGFLDSIIEEIGTEQLDRLNFSSGQLRKSKNLNYIAGKGELRKNNYKRSSSLIAKSLKPDSSYYPNQLFLLASSQLLGGDYKKAGNNFIDCENSLKNKIPSDESFFGYEKRMILDSCILNQARLDFERGNFLLASKQYEKIEKSSLVWPSILFEEAWSSFYQGNYNRALGKLVTYKSPFFEFVFNPEVEVLEALSYMEICFYENTQKVVNKFYEKYGSDSKYLKRFLNKYGSNNLKIGTLLINFENGTTVKNKLLNRIFNSIRKDLVFSRLINNYESLRGELELVKKYPERKYRSYLAKKLKSAEKRQRRLIGSYAIRILDRSSRLLDKSFRGMSYIRLEILKKEKEKFFGKNYTVGKVGNLKNVKFDSKSYLWEFNGEFWADELGDYVFSLKSQCI